MLVVFFFFAFSSYLQHTQKTIAIYSYNQHAMHTRVLILNKALHAQPYLLDWYEEQHGWP